MSKIFEGAKSYSNKYAKATVKNTIQSQKQKNN